MIARMILKKVTLIDGMLSIVIAFVTLAKLSRNVENSNIVKDKETIEKKHQKDLA